MSRKEKASDRWVVLDWMRAIFCVMIVLYHTRFFFLIKTPVILYIQNVFAQMYMATDLFFILSGFILHMNYSYDKGAWAFRGFLIKRFIRIVPLYWALTILVVITTPDYLSALSSGSDYMWNWFFKSMCFIPLESQEAHWGAYPILLPGWVLGSFLWCYLIYGFSIFLSIQNKPIFLIFVLGIGVGIGENFPETDFVFKGTAGSAFNVDFLYGIIAAEFYRYFLLHRHVKKYLSQLTLFFVGISVFSLYFHRAGYGPLHVGIPMLMVFLLGLCCEVQKIVPQIKGIQVLSKASYSIYLAHIALFGKIHDFIPQAPSTMIEFIYYLLLLSYIFITGYWGIYFCIERNLTNWFAKRQ